MSADLDHYCVMGNPISHSLSPRIHMLFAQQLGQHMDYVAIEPPLEGFADQVRKFQAGGGRGLNVTVPFKQEAWQLADQRSEMAERAGAVNTLWFEGDKIYADNTDGKGLVRDIVVNQKQSLTGKDILILGAGGAVRGVLEPLLNEQPQAIVISNRTCARAEALVSLFADHAGNTTLNTLEYADLSGEKFDLIINGTSASLQGEVPPIPDNLMNSGTGCYDMMYSKLPTAFVKWGLDHGAFYAIDGLGMLVEQAAEAFYIWRGVRPETEALISQFRC